MSIKYFTLFLLSLVLLFSSCEDDEERFANNPPDTFFSIKEINLSGDNRLNSIVRLSWYGTDTDGYIKGYEISLDGQQWSFTTTQDSTFRFNLTQGSDTTDIQVFVRAIDNNNERDPSPDELTIPIKNTAPVASFDKDLTIPDTAYLVATTAWKATDLDGDESITKVSISINGKKWYELNKSKPTISIVAPTNATSDTVDALIYYESENTPQAIRVEGLVLNDTNKIYLKAEDQAGTESLIDTSTTFFMKGKTNDILVVGGVEVAHDDYKTIFNNAGITYDFINMTANGGENQPKLWNITFRLQLLQYSKLFFYSDEAGYINPFSNVKSILLEFAAASLQEYANLGGKYLVSTSFDHDTNIDGFIGVLPIASVSAKDYGDARFYGDSVGTSSLNDFPEISPTGFAILGTGVFNIDSADTEVIYEAALSDRRRTIPWPDTEIIASGRRVNGKLNQVFFSVQLFELNGDQQALQDLFNQIFNVEFQ